MAIVEGEPRIARRVGLAADLERHGDATAVVDVDGSPCSYRELAARADAVAARLGSSRRLVLVEATNDLDGITAYLGALRGGHVVLLAAADEGSSALLDTYRPDVVIGAGLAFAERCATTAHDLHPGLALLLSTSGSTGSPKLVRLSHGNLEANAAAIARYLGLRPDDRAITSLPLQYCYGLSVLHSHLAVGAGIVCTPASVVDPCFWRAVDRHGVTNLAGVPHTFELLARTDFADAHHPSIRLLTQAGGRLDPEQVRHWHRTGQRRGFDLYVMYGQTEATARMAYLPPPMVEERAGAVGVAIPGGSFRLAPVDGAGPDEGELVYAGPNVMLGYAEGPAELALGRTVRELRTGDLARIDEDGVVEIVGRLRQFVKVFGLRLDLRRLGEVLAEHGIHAECLGDDTGLAVAVLDDRDPREVRALLAERTGLPASAIAVAAVTDLPRLANGKVDVPGLTRMVRHGRPTEVDDRTGSVADLLGRLLGTTPGPRDSFVSLGGDSLTYVEASIALEERLGRLPRDWHLRPIAELGAEPASRPTRRTTRTETGVLLRAVAIVLVVGNHTGAFLVPGGAHVLFAAAGFNMARFQLTSGTWARGIARIAVPSALWIGGAVLLGDDGFDLAHVLLVHGLVDGGGRWIYWFIEALVQVLVATALVMRVPAVRRLEQRCPFGLPALLLVPALCVRFDLISVGPERHAVFRPQQIAWIFLLGWLAARSTTPVHRVAVTAAAVAAVPGFFGDGSREAVLLGGVLLLVWVPTLPVPRGLPRLLGPLASASLYTYLTHAQVHPLISDRSPVLALVASLAVGVAAWRAAQPVQRRIEAALGDRSATSSAACSPGASPPRSRPRQVPSR